LDATAEYHRSDESSSSCAGPVFGLVHARGRTPSLVQGSSCASGYRGFTRGWDPMFEHRSQASPRGRPRGRIARHFRLARRSRPRPGSVCHPHLTVGGTVERPASSCVTWPASRSGDACSGFETPFARRHGTEALRGFLLRVPDGSSDGKPRTTGKATGRRGDPKVASRGVSHRSEPRGARHAAGTR
jgi:hypothetical protein